MAALIALISPLPYSADFRPYFTIHDPDFQAMTSPGLPPSSSHLPRLLGVTNRYFLKVCPPSCGRPQPHSAHVCWAPLETECLMQSPNLIEELRRRWFCLLTGFASMAKYCSNWHQAHSSNRCPSEAHGLPHGAGCGCCQTANSGIPATAWGSCAGLVGWVQAVDQARSAAA